MSQENHWRCIIIPMVDQKMKKPLMIMLQFLEKLICMLNDGGNPKPEKPPVVHEPIKIDPEPWDDIPVRHETRRRLLSSSLNDGIRIELIGHTDEAGDGIYNRKLGLRRTIGVYSKLKELAEKMSVWKTIKDKTIRF